MGVYNTYGEACGQLKIGACELKHFDVGDQVDIPDGVYLTYANVIVIVEGAFAAEFDYLVDKWGDSLSPEAVIREGNPLFRAVELLNEPTQKT